MAQDDGDAVVKRNLLTAVATMRSACDEAERAAQDGTAESVRRVMHALTWGWPTRRAALKRRWRPWRRRTRGRQQNGSWMPRATRSTVGSEREGSTA